jgi:hypothetical protein
MGVPAVVVLVLLALLLGAALGAWYAQPVPLSLDGPEPPPTTSEPEPLPLPPGLQGRFLPLGERVAAALAEKPLDENGMAQLVAHLAAEGWQLGVSDLRQQLVAGSGLSPALTDHLATLAIVALEARHGATSPR